MEQQAVSARTSPRRRPLETCGAAILAMARVFYTRSQDLRTLTAKFADRCFRAVFFVASFTSPFHCHLLAMLSAVDDHILALQETLETYFPSSKFFFSRTQDLLVITEALPEKLDNVLEKVPDLINHTVVLDWVLVLAIYWLDSLVGVLTRFRDKNTKEKEKEIMVDKSFSRSGSMFLEEVEKKHEPEKRRATYKEVLQKGNGGEDGGSDDDGDPILELFKTGWLQSPMKRSCRSADSLMFSAF